MERAEGLISSPPRVIQGITLKFPTKLWRIINRCNTGAVSWNSSGTAVIIRREPFEDEFLSVNGYFKTTNFTSFVRQLNIYGFRKLVTRQMWYERDSIFEYYHPCFQRGHPELLPNVVRKAKKGTAIDTAENLQETATSSRLNKVIFLEKPRTTMFPYLEEDSAGSYDPDHPLLNTKFRGRIPREKSGGRPGSSGDMGWMSPGRLHQQVAGVVPGMDVGDEDHDTSEGVPDFLDDQTETLYVEIEKQKMRKDYLPTILLNSNYQPMTPVHKNFQQHNIMKSPDLVLLSQSSTDSESSKSMELMFSSIVQDDQEPDCLVGTLHDSFEITTDAISSPEVNVEAALSSEATGNQNFPSQVATTWMPTDSGDLDSYPFPMGDTLLEYSEDDMGVFTPAYFNPSTGMVTLLLPNAAGDN